MRIQQLRCTHKQIEKVNPLKIEPSQKNVAILVHVFYVDVWREIQSYLAKLEIKYDLYISVPHTMESNDILSIFHSSSEANIYMTENRGRDVLPFLEVLNIIGVNTYKYICKLHSKKTGDSELGSIWRKLLYFDLIGSNEIVEDILDLFQSDSNIGMITGKNTILNSDEYMYENAPKIEMLKKECHIESNNSYPFAAGTMFWIKPEILINLIKMLQVKKLDFEDEKGQTDNTLAHALERFFGLLYQVKDKSIAQSPSSYSKLGDKVLDELAELVLSQEYIDKNYVKKLEETVEYFENQSMKHEKYIEKLENQIEKFEINIIKLEAYIKELESLAESMRIKNRLKAIIPSYFFKKNHQVSTHLSKSSKKNVEIINNTQKLKKLKPSRYFKTFRAKDYTLNNIVIDIIIPVYNGYKFLNPLFDSLERNTFPAHRLIVVNDCSPDEKVKPLLKKRLEKYPSSIFIDHKENQGFLKSVNEAYSYISDHFIILNTDTEVPAFWIERLMYPIVHMEKISSTTPFTNSGEIASFPNFLADNDIFEDMSVDKLDEVFRDINPKYFYEEVPTGVGFCMGVNYHLTKEIGLFVEDTFGKGYGEENDWCQRAIQKGYKNYLVPNLFVYHKHGGSFSAEEKRKLLKENSIKLLAKHPNYGKDVDAYIEKNPHESLRNILVMIASARVRSIDIIFDHDLGGGANIYKNKLLEKYAKEERNTLEIKFDFYSNMFKISHKYKNYTSSFSVDTFSELTLLLEKIDIREIFLNSLVSYKGIYEILEYINDIVEKHNIVLTIPIHDYNPISANYTLLCADGAYHDDLSLEGCQKCIENNDLEWRSLVPDEINLKLWRELWFKLLKKSDNILCFSNSSKDILLSAYPALPAANIKVIPHTVEALNPVRVKRDTNSNKITVGVLGAINYAKGLYVLKDMIKIIEEKNLDIDIVVIGEVSESIRSEHFRVTGRYKKENLPKLIQQNHIDVFLIPSIVPETFSCTTQEIIAMEMPIIVFNIGAPAERVLHYERGHVIDEISAKSVLAYVEKLFTQNI